MDTTLGHPNPAALAGRRFVPDVELATMVAQTIQGRLITRTGFTAYTITRSLRRINPTLEITHERVRSAVHQAMDVARRMGAPAEGWTMTRQTFDAGKTATCYGPPVALGTAVVGT